MIELIDVSVTIKNQKIISNFSYTFEAGKCYGLIGSSGCGKTTLIKLISQISTVNSGQICYKGLTNIPLKESSSPVYPILTTVFQDFKLFPHLSVYENIILPLITNNLMIDENEIIALFSYFNLTSILKSKPFEISTGQRQRVAFIRAVLLKPKILLLDEITSALDIESIQLIINYLNKLKNEGTMLIIATHSISFCKKICDNYLFIDRGELNSFGEIKDIENLHLSERLKKFLNSY